VQEGKKTGGGRLVREAQALAEKALGPHHAWLPPLYQKIAPLLDECGQQNEAEALLRDAWTFDQAKFPVNHPRLMNSALLYSANLSERGRFPESEAVLRELHDRYAKELPKDSWRAVVVGMRLGSILTAKRKFDESERLLTDANATLVRSFDPSDAPVVESRALLARLYRAWGKPEKAKP